MKLTKETVARLTLPAGKTDMIFFDDALPGFGVRLRAGGTRTWIVQYRMGAKQRRFKLGAVGALAADKAREEASRKLAAVTLGGDPQKAKHEARARAALTVVAVVDRYLAHKEPVLRPKSFTETKRYLTQHWRPLHGLPIHELQRRDVAIHLGEITIKHGPIAAARARVTLSGLLAWAMREGIAEANVVTGTNKPTEARSRDRVLTDTELTEIWGACRDDDHGRIVRLLTLTGQRREEVGGIRWSELDLDRGVWNLPGERTKNKRPHVVPLVPAAVAILKSAPHRSRPDGAGDHVFGEGKGGFSGWSKAKAGLDRRINTARTDAAAAHAKHLDERQPIADWRIHDLRRTCSTRMAELGVLPHVIEAVINHISGHKAGVAGVYNRATYEPEKKATLAIWADHVRTIVDGGERKIVSLRGL